jgi:hypothetical protein
MRRSVFVPTFETRLEVQFERLLVGSMRIAWGLRLMRSAAVMMMFSWLAWNIGGFAPLPGPVNNAMNQFVNLVRFRVGCGMATQHGAQRSIKPIIR